MATTNAQRTGILIIMIVTVIGTLGSFAVMILASQNQSQSSAQNKQDLAQYLAQYAAYQKQVQTQADKLSTTYYPVFKQYSSAATSFDKASVTSLSSRDLLVGSGATVTDTTNFSAYYIGWNPSGKVFYESIASGTLKAPLAVTGLKNAGLTEGWKQGLVGMKIGGVRELSIPSSLAYGAAGQGADIPANTPLKFIVMAIPAQAAIPEPAVPPSLLQGATQ